MIFCQCLEVMEGDCPAKMFWPDTEIVVIITRVQKTNYTLTENIVSSTQGSKCWYQLVMGYITQCK